MKEDMKGKIARARQHANDILVICDALELRLAMQGPAPKRKKAPNGTFDRTKYQRDYMRAYMAKRRRGPKLEVK